MHICIYTYDIISDHTRIYDYIYICTHYTHMYIHIHIYIYTYLYMYDTIFLYSVYRSSDHGSRERTQESPRLPRGPWQQEETQGTVGASAISNLMVWSHIWNIWAIVAACTTNI